MRNCLATVSVALIVSMQALAAPHLTLGSSVPNKPDQSEILAAVDCGAHAEKEMKALAKKGNTQAERLLNDHSLSALQLIALTTNVCLWAKGIPDIHADTAN